jgi:hypothetical protein
MPVHEQASRIGVKGTGMASGKRNPTMPGGSAAGRRRRPPTIDLTATEIDAGAPATAAAAAPEQAAAAEPPKAQRAAPDAMQPAAGARATSSSSSAPPPEPPPSRRGGHSWLPFDLARTQIVAGLVGAAIVLAVFAVLWLTGLMTSLNSDSNVPTARLAVLELQIRDLNDRIAMSAVDPKSVDNLRKRLVALEAAASEPQSPAVDAALATRVTAMESAAKSLAAALADFDRRVADSMSAGRDVQKRIDAVAATLSEMQQKIAGLRAPDIERGDIDRLASRMANLETMLKAMREERAKPAAGRTSDHGVRLALAADALRAAVEGGKPFVSELAAAKPLAADPSRLALLEPYAASGVPNDAALARELIALLPAAKRAPATPQDEGGLLQRLQANAERLVRVRPVSEVSDGEPRALIERIEARAARGDLAGARAEVAKLPAAMRAPVQAWEKNVEARDAAIALSRRFAADALAALGKAAR